ncbi:hypothetical protein PQR18_29000 [Paraburkholderia sediminicola]
MIMAVVASSDKQRFSLSLGGKRIRAAQGHSVDVGLGDIATRVGARHGRLLILVVDATRMRAEGYVFSRSDMTRDNVKASLGYAGALKPGRFDRGCNLMGVQRCLIRKMKNWRKLPAGCEKQTVCSSPPALAWASTRAFLTFAAEMASGAPIPHLGTTAYCSRT